MVNTYELDLSVRKKIKIDGLLLFGGKDSKDNMSNDLKIFEACGKYMEIDCKGKKWQTVEVLGQRPIARYDHSMSLVKSKGLLVVVGGRNRRG